MKKKSKKVLNRAVSLTLSGLMLASLSMPGMQAYAEETVTDLVMDDGGTSLLSGGTTTSEEPITDSTSTAENQCGDAITWSYNNGLLTLNGTGDMYHYALTTAPWYPYADEIMSIDIAPGITSIGSYAFYGCAINTVTIPTSVTEIGTGAFDSCEKMQSVTIPEGVTTIQNDAFYGCQMLTNLRLPSTLTTIGNRAFLGTVLENVTYAGDGTAFNQISIGSANTALTEANITYETGASGSLNSSVSWKYDANTKTLTISGTGSFDYSRADSYPWDYYRSSIETVVVEEGITGIGRYAFQDCQNLVTVSLPDSLTGILPIYAFDGCTSLKNLTIPEGITEVDSNAFSECQNLQSVILPASVIKVGSDAFYNCENVERLIILGTDVNIEVRAFYNCYDLHEVAINSSIAQIGNYAFAYCDKLLDISFPEGLISLGAETFYGCQNLQTITLPSSLQTVELDRYDGIVDKNIKYNADLKHWIGIENIQYLGSNDVTFAIDSIESGQCGTNITWTFDSVAKTLTLVPTDSSQPVTINGYSLDWKAAPWSSFRGSIHNLVIAEGISAIRSQAFYQLNNLQSISLPKSMEELDSNAFSSCSNVSKVYYAGSYNDWQGKNWYFNSFRDYEVVYNTSSIPDSSETSGTCGDYLNWNFDASTGTLTISSTQPDSMFAFTPGSAPWYQYANQIRTVVMDSGVTLIGDYAFADCINLSSVTLPDKLSAIGAGAFSNCVQLESIEIPDGVEMIGQQAFYNCTRLRTVSIPVTVTIWGDGCFDNCSFWDVYYAGSQTQWQACGGAQYIPENVMHYGSNIEATSGQCGDQATWSFDQDTGALVISGSGPMYDYDGMVQPWNSILDLIQSVNVQEGITHVGDYSFNGCYNLQKVLLSQSVTEIGRAVFDRCNVLENVHYMGSWSDLSLDNASQTLLEVLTFGQQTFGDGLSYSIQDGVLTISGTGEMPPMDSYWYMDDNGLWVGFTPWRAYRSEITKVVIQDGVTSVSAGSLCGFPNLVTIELPSTLQSWDYNALTDYTGQQIVFHGSREESPDFGNLIQYVTYENNAAGTYSSGVNWEFDEATRTMIISGYGRMDCKTAKPWSEYPFNEAIEHVVIEDGITAVDEEAFYNCLNLQSVSFPDTLLDIGQRAFYRCNLQSLVIPDNVVIGNSAFCRNEQLSDVLLGENVSFQDYYRDGFENGGSAFADCPLLLTAGPADGDYDIRITFGNTRSIAAYAFDACSSLTEVTIPESVIVIGESAFNGCTNLKSINLPDSLMSIDQYAFAATGLVDVIIPESALTIQEGAFSQCQSLQSVQLPEGMTRLYSDVFSGCSALSSIDIPSGVTVIDNRAFYGCTSLNGITLPDNLLEIGYQVFANCTSLTHISLPNGLEYLDGTFAGCTALSSIRLPSGIQWMNGVFSGCISLTSLTIPNSVTQLSGLDGCTSLQTVVLPTQLEVIEAGTFSGCKQLDSVTIPRAVTRIEQNAFKDCYNFSTIYYQGTETEWTDIQIDSYGNSMLLSCPQIYYNAEIPEETSGECGKDLIWGFDQASGKLIISGSGAMYAFAEAPWAPLADKIASVEIGSGITNISADSFADCNNLHAVTLPETLDSIESNAFLNCGSLQTVNYSGSMAQWGEIFIEDGNESLLSADIQFGRRGDIDFNGITDARDAILLTRYLSGWENVMVQTNTADINTDGKVDALDAVYLTRSVAGWNGYDLEK